MEVNAIESLMLGSTNKLEMKPIKLKKGKVNKLTVSNWTDGDDTDLSISFFEDVLKRHLYDTVEIEKVFCRTKSSLNRLNELLSVASLQRWSVDKLSIDGDQIEIPRLWLGLDALQGSINSRGGSPME